MAEQKFKRDPIFPWMMETPAGQPRIFQYMPGSPQERMLVELRGEELKLRNFSLLGAPLKRPGQS